MGKVCKTLTPEESEVIFKKMVDFGVYQVLDWCLPFPREYVIRDDAPKDIFNKARKIDEMNFLHYGKHMFRNFMTDPEEIKAFDDHVEWALQQPTE